MKNDDKLLYLKGYDNLENSTIKEDSDLFFKSYFNTKKEIKSINKEIIRIEENNKIINDNLQKTNIKLNCDIKGVNYDNINVTKSKIHDSQAETSLINEINKLERLIYNNELTIMKLNSRKNMLELKNSSCNIFIGMLSEKHVEILELKYIEEKTNLQIGIKVNLSEGTIRKQINRIAKIYSEWRA